METMGNEDETQLHKERTELLHQVEDWLEKPMQILGFLWLVLLVVEFTGELPPFLYQTGLVIWALFVLEFVLRLFVAERRWIYLRNNLLTLLSLVIPALRVFRVVRFLPLLRAARGLRLLRVVASLNRGIRALRASMRRRGFGYVLLLTLIIITVGAAGMYSFERSPPGQPGLQTYGDALWWTAMVVITIGSEFWPQTPEGRVLCLGIALYGFAMFGYITAAFASFFIGRDAESEQAEIAGARAIKAVEDELRSLRSEIKRDRAR